MGGWGWGCAVAAGVTPFCELEGGAREVEGGETLTVPCRRCVPRRRQPHLAPSTRRPSRRQPCPALPPPSTAASLHGFRAGAKRFLSEECGIPAADIRGFRNPYLKTNPLVRRALHEHGFLFDRWVGRSGRGAAGEGGGLFCSKQWHPPLLPPTPDCSLPLFSPLQHPAGGPRHRVHFDVDGQPCMAL